MNYINYGRQLISGEDIEKVVDVLRSDFLTQGHQTLKFEEDLSIKFEAPFSVAVNSATSGLHIACIALGLGPGDIAWTVPNTFVASANAILMTGAKVDFVDIDLDSHALCLSELRCKLESARSNNLLPKVVIPVHFSGAAIDMASLNELSREFGFKVIEDASHAVGASYVCGARVGSCVYSDLTVFSFHPVKIITTGEGGAVLTKSPELYDRLVKLRSHGVTRDMSTFVEKGYPDWYYEQHELGYNYRMTDIQAALGRSQLKKTFDFIQKRLEVVDFYERNLDSIKILKPKLNHRSSWHLYVIRLENSITRDKCFREARAAQIGVNVHYFPVHLQPYYRNLGFKDGDFPCSERYGQSCLTLPIHPALSEEDLMRVVNVINENA